MLYSHSPLFQPGITELGKQFVWAAGWLSSAQVSACWLAAGYLSCKEPETVVTVSLERKAGSRQMFAWWSLFVAVQEPKNGLTPLQCIGETLPRTTLHTGVGQTLFWKEGKAIG